MTSLASRSICCIRCKLSWLRSVYGRRAGVLREHGHSRQRFNPDKMILYGTHSRHIFCRDDHGLPGAIVGDGALQVYGSITHGDVDQILLRNSAITCSRISASLVATVLAAGAS